MQGHASTLRFNDNRRQLHHLSCSKSGQQGDVFETVQFAATVTIHPSPLRFNDNRRQLHHLSCSKSGQQGDVFETVQFAATVTIHPSIGRVFERDPACIVSAKGPPFAMILRT